MDLDATIAHFQEHGFARLGAVLRPDQAKALAIRAQSHMLGQQPTPGLFYQHDSPTGRYEDLDFGAGWVGPSPRYRKLERLERDPQILGFIENPVFRQIAHRVLGEGVQLYRSVLWNKAPNVGMAVPWHQDDGRFWGLSEAPFLQVWTALDDATVDSGCLEVVPGSHLEGLASPEGGTIVDVEAANARALALPALAGESILVHNHLWHRTGRNQTGAPRRAISVSFLSGTTTCRRKRRAPRQFLKLWASERQA